MPDDSYDVLVIGGGVIGVCTTYFLAREGKRVALLEGGGIASGASHGNAGWISPSHALPLPAPGVMTKAFRWLLDPESPFYIRPRCSLSLIRWLYAFSRSCGSEKAMRTFGLKRDLLLASRDLYDNVTHEENINCDFAKMGVLVVCETQKGLIEARQDLESLESLGGKGEALSSSEIAERMPFLAPGLAGGIFYPEDAHVRPDSFVHGLAEAAARHGADVILATEVLDFHLDGKRINRVIANRGEFFGKQIVLAAGAWSGPLARKLGVPILLEAAKGYSVTIERPEDYPNLPVMLSESKVGVTPMGDWLRFAGTLELAGINLDLNSRRVGALWNAARRHMPGIDTQLRIETWRGLRPCAPDDLPYLGRSRHIENLVIATGNGMHGIGQGPITGHLAAQLVQERQPDFDISPYDPDRFQWEARPG